MPRTKLSKEDKRSAVLAALRGGKSKERIAQEFGVSRQRVYELLWEATDTEERDFQRDVEGILRVKPHLVRRRGVKSSR